MAYNYTLEELSDMHLLYGEAKTNGRKAKRLYAERFPNRHHPCHTLFASLDRRLRETGSLKGSHHNGARRTVRTVEFEEEVLNILGEEPAISTRSIAHQLGSAPSTVWKVAKEQLLHPYRRQKVQALLAGDFHQRTEFCNWYMQRCNQDNQFPQSVLFTDESCFSREGLFNSHNSHVWSDVNPHALFVKSHQQRFSLNVWAGMIGSYLLGPYFMPPRLNGEVYMHFLDQSLPELLEDIPLVIRQRMWFQHDGAPAHSSYEISHHLDTNFPDRWIGRRGPVPWPPRSPDLTPLDFFLWGHVKSIVYRTPVDTVAELRARIVAAFERVRTTPGIFQRVQESMLQRCRICMEVNGHHFEQLI